MKISINSMAKINFGLNIVEKRSDGFHNLETIFYPIELCDKLTFEKADFFSFSSNIPTLDIDPSNLVIKAFNIVEKYIGKKLNAKITLEKNIPIGGGLGGGSSNAAHTLVSIPLLFGFEIPQDFLRNMALTLGSDVPFFIKPIPSYASSRGEILEPISFDINKPLLIVNPKIHISTKWAFQNITPRKPGVNLKDIIQNNNNFSDYKNTVRNDFEDLVIKTYPELNKLKSSLYDFGAEFVLMSGSGSTFFAIFSDLEMADYAKQFFEKKYFCYLQANENE